MKEWTLVDLLKFKLYCKKRLQNEKDSEMIERLKLAIESINNIIKPSYAFTLKNSYEDTLMNDEEFLQLHGVFAPYIRILANSDLPLNFDNTPQKINFSKNMVLYYAKDFYLSLGGLFKKKGEEIFASKKIRLKFKKLRNNSEVYGITNPILGTNRYLIELGYNNSLNDYISLIHEIGHVISYSINQEHQTDYRKYAFIETDTIFWELIGSDFLARELGLEKDALQINIDVFNDYCYTAKLLTAKMDILNLFTEKELRNRKEAKNFLVNKGYKKEDIKKIFSDGMEKYFCYVVSYLVAIELYFEYLKDKEKALKLLLEIIKLKGMSQSEYLNKLNELGIHIGHSLKNYYSLLAKRMGEIQSGKKLQYTI